MIGGVPLAFGAPAMLLALVALPVIWWLLRLTPPKPQTEVFPPLRILARVARHEETPAHSPWWLTLLRLMLAALVILALARPILNPSERIVTGSGPLALLVDNGWASVRDWDGIRAAALRLVDEAEAAGVPIAVAMTAAPENADVALLDAGAARELVNAAKPEPIPPAREAAAGKLLAAIGDAPDATLATLTDGLASGADTLAELAGHPFARVVWYDPGLRDLVAISGATNAADAFDITLVRPADGDESAETIAAFDERGRRIAEAAAAFEDGPRADAAVEAPFELRNDFALLRIDGQQHAGGVWLVDDSSRRRRIGLLSGAPSDQALPLLAPLYYITRALRPYADLVEGATGDLSEDVPAMLDRSPAVIVLADIGRLPENAETALAEWVEQGGTLVRFAGPRLAAGADGDPLLPVALRQGERSLGGALSWTEPQLVDAFPAEGPFAGLSPPQDVSVTRQVLAEPGPDLIGRTWAVLQDGTPLVTGANQGAGTVVLFHVTAEATWSNLPISGTFVDMLRRIVQLSRNTGAGATADADQPAGAALPPARILNAAGELELPPPHVKPLQPASGVRPTWDNPPGLYGTPEGYVALNLLTADSELAPLQRPEFTAPVTTMTYAVSGETDMRGLLFLLAAALLALDGVAVLWMTGFFRRFRAAAPRAAAVVLLATLAAVPDGRSALAQDMRPGDETIIEGIDTTRIAYVLSGNAETDRVSEAGLLGLTEFLRTRTAFEPGEPVGVDIASDELALFPLLYFPIDASAAMPSDEAVGRLDAYMQNGGTILFDTRDQLSASLQQAGAVSAENERLRAILDGLNVPPLEPVPADHVLTKAFYLMENFPGRYAGSPLWVEALSGAETIQDRPVRSGDGVSPILITGNDLAAAWAIDSDRRPLLPIVGGDPMQRIHAYRAGVNIVMYMLTGNYKADQVHVPAILERLGQ